MDSEDMLYILTSGSTGKPDYRPYPGGYAVGGRTTTKFVFDIRTTISSGFTDVGWWAGLAFHHL